MCQTISGLKAEVLGWGSTKEPVPSMVSWQGLVFRCGARRHVDILGASSGRNQVRELVRPTRGVVGLHRLARGEEAWAEDSRMDVEGSYTATTLTAVLTHQRLTARQVWASAGHEQAFCRLQLFGEVLELSPLADCEADQGHTAGKRASNHCTILPAKVEV